MVDVFGSICRKGSGSGRWEAGRVVIGNVFTEYLPRRIGGGWGEARGRGSLSRAYSRYYTPSASVICAVVR